jgi:hypothetical protein
LNLRSSFDLAWLLNILVLSVLMLALIIFATSFPLARRLREERFRIARSRRDGLLDKIRLYIPPSVDDEILGDGKLAPLWTHRWFRSFYIGAILQASVVLFMSFLPLSAIMIAVDVDSEPKTERSRKNSEAARRMLDNLLTWGKDGEVWQWYSEDPGIIAILAVVFLTLLALVIIFIRARFRLRVSSPEKFREVGLDPPSSSSLSSLSDYSQCWPVVVLWMTALQCSRVHYQIAHGEDQDKYGRVSLADAERIIWSMHRFRNLSYMGRRHRKKALKDHSARVVGALRAVEARQDVEPLEALERLTAMLLEIAEMYCQGRLGALLPPEELADAQPAAPREAARFILTTSMIVGVVAIASILGLPDAALGALLPVAVIVLVAIFSRGRLPGPSQMTDLIIPR